MTIVVVSGSIIGEVPAAYVDLRLVHSLPTVRPQAASAVPPGVWQAGSRRSGTRCRGVRQLGTGSLWDKFVTLFGEG